MPIIDRDLHRLWRRVTRLAAAAAHGPPLSSMRCYAPSVCRRLIRAGVTSARVSAVTSGSSKGSRGLWKRANPCVTRTVFQPSCRAGRMSLSSRSPIITASDGAHRARSRANVKIAGSGFSSPNSKEHRHVAMNGVGRLQLLRIASGRQHGAATVVAVDQLRDSIDDRARGKFGPRLRQSGARLVHRAYPAVFCHRFDQSLEPAFMGRLLIDQRAAEVKKQPPHIVHGAIYIRVLCPRALAVSH